MKLARFKIDDCDGATDVAWSNLLAAMCSLVFTVNSVQIRHISIVVPFNRFENSIRINIYSIISRQSHRVEEQFELLVPWTDYPPPCYPDGATI